MNNFRRPPSLLLLQGLLFLACLVPNIKKAAAEEPLRIGVIQSLTGIAAEDGNTVVRSLMLARDKLNSGAGPKIELIVEDDQTSSREALTAYKKLTNAGVRAIIGATWDFTTNPLLPLAGEDKVILFNTSTLPECLSLKESQGYGFINAPTAAEDAAPFEKLLKSIKPATVTIFFADNPWGETQRRVYREIAERSGVKVLDEIKPAAHDSNDWRSVMPRIKGKQPDLFVLLVNKGDVEEILRRKQEIGMTAPAIATKNAYHMFRLTHSPAVYEGLCFSYPYEQLLQAKEFSEEYKQRFNEDPRVYADNSFDALFLIASAFDKAKKEKIELRRALAAATYRGLVGEYRYDEKASFSTGRSSLVCIKQGKLELR